MRSRFFVILGLAGTLAIGACSSAIEEKPKAKTDSTVPVNAANASVPGNSNTVVVADGMVVTPQTGDANAASAASSDGAQVPQMQGRLEKMRQADSSRATVDAAALAMKNARPAPDNSTFTSFLTDVGYEIRTFKNHPQLLKVERKTENNGNQTLTIFLRNGKTIQLPGQKIGALSTAPAASIVDAAGLTPPPQKQAETGTTGVKKPSN